MLIFLALWRVDHNPVVLVLEGLKVEGTGLEVQSLFLIIRPGDDLSVMRALRSFYNL